LISLLVNDVTAKQRIGDFVLHIIAAILWMFSVNIRDRVYDKDNFTSTSE